LVGVSVEHGNDAATRVTQRRAAGNRSKHLFTRSGHAGSLRPVM